MNVTLVRGLLVWVLIIGVETVHGILRTIWLAPLVGDFQARQIAVFTGSLLILVIAFWTVRWMQADTPGRLLQVGCLWVVLTVLFEVVLGRLILDLPWERILEDYDLTRGGLLGLGLLCMGASPLLAAKLSPGQRTLTTTAGASTARPASRRR